MNSNHVGANYPNKFGNYAIAQQQTVSVGSTGNAVANLDELLDFIATDFFGRFAHVQGVNLGAGLWRPINAPRR